MTEDLAVLRLVLPDSGGLESLGDDTTEGRKGKGEISGHFSTASIRYP